MVDDEQAARGYIMRLNVFLQRAGVGSRREAERIVAEGRVEINGKIAEPTDPVNDGDQVKFDGLKLAIETRSQPRLYALNKPLDVLVTAHDGEGRMTIYDLPALNHNNLPRLMYVGRLDVNSEGLLLLTDDGPLAQGMMSPALGLPRVYRVRVHGRLSPRDMELMTKGLTIAGIRYRGAKVEEENEENLSANAWYVITIYEGKNREVRKLFEYFGCVVNRLVRVQYGPFLLGRLAAGELKEVPAEMVRNFLNSLKQSEKD
jgi:23S rRNA pseudouridine2605 synthase